MLIKITTFLVFSLHKANMQPQNTSEMQPQDKNYICFLFVCLFVFEADRKRKKRKEKKRKTVPQKQLKETVLFQ